MCLQIAAAATVAACGGDSEPPSPDACASVNEVSLAVGAFAIVDPAATNGCLVLPAAGTSGAEYLVAAIATNGQQVTTGISGEYLLSSGADAMAAASVAARAPATSRAFPSPDGAFHSHLRSKESELAGRPRPHITPRVLAAVAPVVGDGRTFNVCASISCNLFVQVQAHARFVGQRGAIFVDDTVPAGGLTEQDVSELGELFDNHMYPIDTVAFGRESDLDGNGVVIILLTDAVNALSANCGNGSVILGYFFGLDLTLGEPGSNQGEVFYSRVPDAGAPACGHTRDRVLRTLPPTFIHEFQHMISFNQHVLLRGGNPENTWLNEGLSHFAEELGGRQIPDGPVQGSAASRAQQFFENDVDNAYNYLEQPSSAYLVTPGNSFGTLAERGANWLFVRWLADQFDPGDTLGTTFTRALVQTARVGSDNVTTVTGRPFAELVGAWQLANYLDDLPDFVPLDGELRYTTVNLRSTLKAVSPFYPLRPDSVAGTGYARSGVLRAGSGLHVRVVQPAQGIVVRMRLLAPDATALDPLLAGRIAVARVR
jgi:hypothetical protein